MTSKPDHLERTAADPRDKSLHTVVLEHIEQVNNTTRIFRLRVPRDSLPIRFLPGQWLDVYVPGVEKAGGFTITSTPREARQAHPALESEDTSETTSPYEQGKNSKAARGPYLELAVQKSPDNPAAAWLWQDPHPSTADHHTSSSGPDSIIGKELHVRVGGGFVWPPPGINVRTLRRVVFVAGGVGVNPLVSMLCSLASSAAVVAPKATGVDLEVRFLYSLKDPGESAEESGYREAGNMLFLERIARIFRQGRVKGTLEVFLTSGDTSTTTTDVAGAKSADNTIDEDGGEGDRGNVITVGGGQAEDGNKNEEGNASFTIPFHPRRCTLENDVAKAVDNPRFAVVYVCGVPTMTDEFIAKLTGRESEGGLGMEPHRVLCEKWW
ncbi:hypothetical protein E0Z10_g4445 [Xylaria hypoxylon]|uniref:FAD-binding FR-type domain-containing protein n=1 Tax=Xylaria hypoxylon TaxID=37992 RepID=A0A4Z0YJ01_9PEZI|nr:hypothetical protein E0Z10_g4445 [Xylaria hypoxylon]